ncbi:MAG: hypothetical protein ACT4P6_17865 [Gemmatimonadaceae bacterium]
MTGIAASLRRIGGFVRLTYAIASLLIAGAACAPPDQRSKLDSAALESKAVPARIELERTIHEGDSILGTQFGASLSAGIEESLLKAATESYSIITSFLTRLPDAEPGAAPTSEAADTLFALAIHGSPLVSRSLVWGEVANTPGEFASVWSTKACTSERSCRAKALSLPRASDLLRHPDLIAVERSAIEAFLNQPLILPGRSNPIREVKDKELKRAIAIATCSSRGETIRYAVDIDKRFSPIVYAFVRAHEYAHFALRHVRCDGGKPGDRELPSVRIRELLADCSGATMMYARVDNGYRAVDFTAGVFSLLTVPVSDYPSFQERSESLWRRSC